MIDIRVKDCIWEGASIVTSITVINLYRIDIGKFVQRISKDIAPDHNASGAESRSKKEDTAPV